MTAVLMSSLPAADRLRAEGMVSGREVVVDQVAHMLLRSNLASKFEVDWTTVWTPERAERVRRVFAEVVDHEEF